MRTWGALTAKISGSLIGKLRGSSQGSLNFPEKAWESARKDPTDWVLV